MKILFLFPHFLSPGGAANVVLQFANSLQVKGHEVEICCAKVSEEFKQNNPHLQFKELKVPVSHSLFYWLFFPLWQMKINRQLSLYNDYILFPHVLPSNWWAWMYKRKHKNAKIVWYCHEPSAFIHSSTWINAISNEWMKAGAKLLNPFLKRADIALEKENNVVVCNSNFTKAAYERVYKRKADSVIYPPCSIKNIPLQKNKENYILTVCRLSKFKNVDLLIKAFKLISKDLSGCRLLIVGDGEEKKHLQKLAKDLELESSVFFLGNKTGEQLIHLYQNAKVTISCSVGETFGLVPVESMMYGTPVISHNSGGPKETIQHGVTGFLFNNETELINRIKEIFEMDEERYTVMQQKCREEVARFDRAESIKQLELVLHKIKAEPQ